MSEPRRREQGNQIDTRRQRGQGAKKGKAPRQRWHSWHCWQCGLCNLQNLKDARETESLSLRQISLRFVTGRVVFRLRAADARSPRSAHGISFQACTVKKDHRDAPSAGSGGKKEEGSTERLAFLAFPAMWIVSGRDAIISHLAGSKCGQDTHDVKPA